jgi:coiled-coil domain-containing protein 40
MSKDQEDVIQNLNRKIAVMKKAILKEREEKFKETEEIESIKRKIAIINITLSEKDSQASMMNTEKEKIEKDLNKLKDQIRQFSNPSTQGVKKTVASLEQQNKKLLDEYHFLKQQNIDLKNMILALSQEHEQIQKKIAEKDNYIKIIKQKSENTYKEALNQLESSQKDLSDAKKSSMMLSETQIKLTSDYAKILQEQKNLEEEQLILNQELLEKQGNIASLNQRLLKLSENEAALSSKLMDYKNELAEASRRQSL